MFACVDNVAGKVKMRRQLDLCAVFAAVVVESFETDH
jgi:hypothetical protein